MNERILSLQSDDAHKSIETTVAHVSYVVKHVLGDKNFKLSIPENKPGLSTVVLDVTLKWKS
jgi:hypothetical protein